MRYVNKHNFPGAYFRCVVNDPYDRKDTYSPSLLSNPPRATVLLEQNPDVEVDVSTRVAATIGQGAHSILERGARPGVDIIETRFFRSIEVDGVTYQVSAQVDLFETDTGDLSDWKTTKAYAFHKKSGRGKKPEWEAQLNIGRWVMVAEDLPEVKRLLIVGLLKDWDLRKSKDEPGYPETEIMVAEQKMWTLEETEIWIAMRIRAIVAARKELPMCSTKDSWAGRRCAQWCDANSVCSQYQTSLRTGRITEDESA